MEESGDAGGAGSWSEKDEQMSSWMWEVASRRHICLSPTQPRFKVRSHKQQTATEIYASLRDKIHCRTSTDVYAANTILLAAVCMLYYNRTEAVLEAGIPLYRS